ncbi:LOW QUALITY PROTEIN: F-box/kelch-repeat protein SKIP20-like [Asparagus officinalis]|uniref:LOW QUALITY PROTEIN: F-box/kelch-repeat protein SKIP20-like n=1 Tax=Asparagus officinalis TaxID=4686 RepID=UPI00098DFFD6|nr:LOW QUALITY PROTEIN: F-box/kelch-repeat protein SKIP20-like [Asparagus officinalis]
MEKIINMTEQEQALIPGLPDDVAFDCISRVPYGSHSQIRPVCKKWRDLCLVTSPSFSRTGSGSAPQRTSSSSSKVGHAGETKARSPPPPPVYSLNLYNATIATWQRIETPEAIPMFSQCAIAGRQLVLVGGWDPKTLDPVAETRILDLATMAWREGRADGRRRGRSSPAPLFGAESLRGGGTRSKNALRSAEAYDVAADEWCRAYRRMSEERDKAQVVIPWGLEVHGGEAGTGPRAREVQPTSAEVYRRG